MKLVKKIKIKINKECKEYLEFASEKCRLVYNFALNDRIEYYKQNKKTISIYELKKKFNNETKKKYSEYYKVYNKCLSAMFFRLDKAFNHFFIKQNKFPKFKRKNEFISQEYPSEYIKVIDNNRFILPTGKGYDNYIARTMEKIPDKFSTLTINKNKNNYFACFTIEVDENYKNTDKNKYLAIDLGIKTLVSAYSSVKNCFVKVRKFSYYTKHLDYLRSKRDKCKRKSINYKKWNRVFYRELDRYKNKVNDYLHKSTKWLVDRSEDVIIVGKLDLQNLKSDKTWFNKIIYNSWRIGRFVELLDYKCNLYGKDLIKIDERNTTKTCCKCGKIKDKNLSERLHKCECGLTIDRDFNSAINISKKYESMVDADLVEVEFKKLNNLYVDTFVYI